MLSHKISCTTINTIRHIYIEFTNMLDTLLPVIDIVLYMHDLAKKAIISFWELIALYTNLANLHFKLKFTWDTPAIWVKNLVWAVLGTDEHSFFTKGFGVMVERSTSVC